MTTKLRTLNDIAGFQREVDAFLNKLFVGPARMPQPAQGPAVHTGEDADHLYVELVAPGIEPGAFEISVEENALRISGKRERPEHTEGVRWHRSERPSGQFTHRLRLPMHVDRDKITADYRNGILTITLPKAEAAKPRQIEVRVS